MFTDSTGYTISSCQQQICIQQKRWWLPGSMILVLIYSVTYATVSIFRTIASTKLPVAIQTSTTHAITTTGDTTSRGNKRRPYTIQKSLLYDRTIKWDPSVDRMWLDPELISNTQQKWLHQHDTSTSQDQEMNVEEEQLVLPKAMILLTSYGWNQKNQTIALSQHPRQTRESELLDGIINHPHFHPTLWNDLEEGSFVNKTNVTIQSILGIPSIDFILQTRYYIFLDTTSYCDIHYPAYHSFDKNLDTTGGRVNHTQTMVYSTHRTLNHPVWDSIFIQQLTSAIAHVNPSSTYVSQKIQELVKLIYFDCSDEMDPDFKQARIDSGKPVVVAHLTSTILRSDETIDMGLVPPLLFKAAALNETEIQDIYTCAADYDETKRPYYVTYIGNYRAGPNADRFRSRVGFQDFHDNKRMFSLRYFLDEFKESSIANVSYDQILKRSIYSGTPRGDNKYSYRFTEVLASGGIPILVSDDWMLPFRPELVHWEECAIIVPEKDAGMAILKYIAPITLSERCIRRQKCYDIYRNYIETGRKVIKAMIDGLELVAMGVHANMASIHCDPNDPPDSVECNPQ